MSLRLFKYRLFLFRVMGVLWTNIVPTFILLLILFTGCNRADTCNLDESSPGPDVSPAARNKIRSTELQNKDSTVAATSSGLQGLRIKPSSIRLWLGEETPPILVMRGEQTVPATLRSLDHTVVFPEEEFAGHFVASGPGQTEIEAEFQGSTARINVIVTSKRFVEVRVALKFDDTTHASPLVFAKLEVLAAATEGPLEYRVCNSTSAQTGNWIASKAEGEYQRTALISDPLGMQLGRRDLIIESRDRSGDIQQCPIRIWVDGTIQRE